MYKDEVYKLGELAVEAMMKEVACYPSFGLVSPVSAGAHSDMTHYTFIESSAVLHRYFLEMAHIAMSGAGIDEIFARCRKVGVEAEKAMYRKTGGINTHKGMIFVLGITVVAAGIVVAGKRKFKDISEKIKEMTRGIVEAELKHLSLKTDLTHGERVFLEYGITGIRGEVEAGIPAVFEHGLVIYEDSGLPQNERLVYTLLGIMAYCEDTTILYRHNLDTLREVKRRSQEILKSFGGPEKIHMDTLKKISQEFSERRISPGGCADLLAVTIFLSLVREEFFSYNFQGANKRLSYL